MKRTIRAPLRVICCIPPGRHGPYKVDIRPIDSPSLRAAIELRRERLAPDLCAAITYDDGRKSKPRRKKVGKC